MRIVRLSLILCCLLAAPTLAAERPPVAQPVDVGKKGAVATVDPYASQAALGVLKHGGNAVDAAVAGLAALGVVEPYSIGIGGGGFMVIRTAKGKIVTIDGRETAPASMDANSFIDPSTGQPYPFATAVTSGRSVGVPGALRAWELARKLYGREPLKKLLQPAIDLARGGFVMDATLNQQTKDNAARFAKFPSTAAIYLTPDGQAKPTGSVITNPDLADTLTAIAKGGVDAFYTGPIAQDIANTVQHPPLAPGADPVLTGGMTPADIAKYAAIQRAPTHVNFRGLDVWGMGPPSSGGTTVGEALNIMNGIPPSPDDRVTFLHHYLEATALAYADRNAYLGDPAFTPVPVCGLLSAPFADQRRSLIGASAAPRPVAFGDPNPFNGSCPDGAADDQHISHEGPNTSNLTVADAKGNVVIATFTIEQTGGSGIVVPHRGFLLNNELTDFDFTGGHPNSPAAGKRPRSSISPTLVTQGGKPYLAVGSPGGATIITTVLQTLLERIDNGKSLPGAIETPRLSDRNGPKADAEPDFMASPQLADLQALGHQFNQVPEIGAATGIDWLGDNRMQAVAEARRRGGGSAMATG